MRSKPAHDLLLIFKTRKYFTTLFKFLDFLRSLDRFKVLIWVIISEFYYKTFIWLGEKNSLKYLLPGGGGETFVPPMSKQCRHRLCPKWLTFNWRIVKKLRPVRY